MRKTFLTALFLSVFMGTFAQRGSCGEELSWSLSDGTLTISGKGLMDDYYYESSKPSWDIYKDNIKRIVVEPGVESIGDMAFSLYSAVESVELPDDLKAMGDYAFYGCVGLKAIKLPAGLISIGNGTFSYCHGLTTVTIPEKLQECGNAFSYCNNLVSVVWNADARIDTAYYWRGETEYLTVSEGGMFTNSPVKTLTIGDNVKVIPAGLFYGCPSLEYIHTSNTVECIGDGAFDGTLWLNNHKEGPVYLDHVAYKYIGTMTAPTDFEFPEGVTGINKGFFGKQPYLVKVTIPSTLKYIGTNIFYDCPSLVDAVWNAKKCLILVTNGGTLELRNPMQFTSALSNITFGNEVEYIPYALCGNCSGLRDIVLPNSVKEVSTAFSGCSGVKSIKLSESLTVIGSGAFSGCSKVSEIELPASTDSIAGYAFSGCALTELTIPENVRYIGDAAFANNSIETLHYNAVNCDFDNKNDGVFGNNKLKTIIVGDKVEVVPNIVMNNENYLTSVTIGESVTDIRFGFNGCKNFTDLTMKAINMESVSSGGFGNNLENVVLGDKVMRVPADAFKNCKKLKSVTIPGAVKFIGSSAFYGSGLESVTLPDNVTDVERSAFYGCENLASVSLGGGLRNLGEMAFYNCSSLKSVVLPESMTELKNGVFGGCGNLSSVYIPETVVSIESSAFYGSALTSLFIPKSVTSVGSDAFGKSPLTEVIMAAAPSADIKYPFSSCPDLKSVYVADVDGYNKFSAWMSSGKLKAMVSFATNSYVYNGVARELSLTNNLTAYTMQADVAPLSADAGDYELMIKTDFSGARDFSVQIPYRYTIQKASLNVNPYDFDRIYGSDNSVIEYKVEGLVNGETIEYALSEAPVFVCDADRKSPVGQYEIRLSNEPVAKNYSITYGRASMGILPKDLSVTAVDATREYGCDNPDFTILYDGFVNDENEKSLYAPYAYCMATSTSDVGDYEIIVEGGYAQNYNLVYNKGVLHIVKASQEIIWENDLQTMNVGDVTALYAYATSGLPVGYSTDAPELLEINLTEDGYVLKAKAAGTVVVTARQAGDGNWNLAEEVRKEIVIKEPSGINTARNGSLKVYPEGKNIIVRGADPCDAVNVYSVNGTLIYSRKKGNDESRIHIDNAGIYIVKVNGQVFKMSVR